MSAATEALGFTSEDGRLVIENRASAADVEIRIPHAAQRVEIRVAGDPRFLKVGPRVVTGLVAAHGSYVVPLTELRR